MSDEAPDERRTEPGDPRRDGKGRFGPGNCANPTGKKGRHTLTGLLRDLLDRDVPGAVAEHGAPLTYAELLVRTAVKHASLGNPTFFREILERMDGKVPERTEVRLASGWKMTYTPTEVEVEGDDGPRAIGGGDDLGE